MAVYSKYMKKAVKKIAYKEPSIREDIRRLGVMMEANNDKIDLVAEQYGDITVTIDGIKEDVGGIKKTLDEHTELFGRVFVDLSIIKDYIEFIKTDLKKKVDIDQFAALEK